MEKINFLSLVIPVHQQAKTIYKNILQLDKALQNLTIQYELIAVVDGIEGDQKTLSEIRKFKKSNLRVLSYKENQGKGHAVKYGMLHAKGDVVGFIDAGMDIDPTGIDMLLNHMLWYDADIIVGSKLHPVSQVRYPFWRKILSWGYRSLTRLLFGFKIRDTQVGIKFFKKKVVQVVFPKLLVKRFAFDVEILAAAYSLGFTKIYEAPVKLEFNAGVSTISKKNFWSTVTLMIWDTMAVFYRVRILHYYQRKIDV